MLRRSLLKAGFATAAIAGTQSLYGNSMMESEMRLEEAEAILNRAVESGLVKSATMHVSSQQGKAERFFGAAADAEAMFLLGSISKPITVTALMALFDQGAFALDDPLYKYLPKFRGEGRDAVTLKHLLSHTSGLPDQLPGNDALRRSHAPLTEFIERTHEVPLHFAPGKKYEYSSMGILLAAHVAELLSGKDIRELTEDAVFKPLDMRRSAQGLGRFHLQDMQPMQTEYAAPEAGGGDPNAKEWDWNSEYWRKLGAPWGGTHASAGDIAKFLSEFLFAQGRAVKPKTAELMTTNQNGAGLTPRGLGMAVGSSIAVPGCSPATFGHTGSTGTIAWADPATKWICVILTSLPARAVTPHPRDHAALAVAKAMSKS
ncbi:MAG: serine hydrolase domain-containing protein [Pirellulales bacterium]